MLERWHGTEIVHQPGTACHALILADLDHQVLQRTHFTSRLLIDVLEHPLAVAVIFVGLIAWIALSTCRHQHLGQLVHEAHVGCLGEWLDQPEQVHRLES